MVKLDNYDASKIEVLEGLKAVRKVPGMYIGNTSTEGLHHMVYEVVDNSVDEAGAGYGDHIYVTIGTDGSITVEDNGRGIPVDIHPKYGKPGLEIVLTELHSGAKFDKKVYKITGGLHGVGVHVVNALSSRLVAVVKKPESMYSMEFSKGITQGTIAKRTPDEITGMGIKLNMPDKSGTVTKFWPDPEIFQTLKFSREILEKRLRELAFLNSNITFILSDESDSYVNSFHFDGGLSAFVAYISEGENPLLSSTIHETSEKDGIILEYALQYTNSGSEIIEGFVNNIGTPEGGTHLAGFKAGLSKAVLDFARKKDTYKGIDTVIGEDIREGIVSIVHVKMMNPQFEGQTKAKLGNSEVKGIVQSMVESTMKLFLESYPAYADKIVKRAMLAAEAREASRRARELVRRKTTLESGTLPGKLSDCSSTDKEKSELYIVEGNSAGGSTKQARNREFQAVLPLRGKILNVEKVSDDKAFSNQIIRDLIAVLGSGIGDEIDLKKLRYGKIIIMTDADVDGAHIRTLLLTFFYRHSRSLITNGNIYFAEPPLFRIQKGDKVVYVYTEEEMNDVVKSMGKNVIIQRFKGLGEMNGDQLWETAMNPDTRKLVKVDIDSVEEADRMFSILMGEKVEPRRIFIEQNARYVKDIDV
ncbi:MAG: type IIA DNA topoisomerase subunit B [Candidatus Thermoplasmatota archaeon]|jgi:DNA gyrase subunit B|nr:type IIA DNA topoisomerase subunit B [Candidatus Thermoplasmatota archaeon]MCL5987952.1 type IIA DNA topoisomerase subunit B [Candidatus Thermoplasmatota archaeon]